MGKNALAEFLAAYDEMRTLWKRYYDGDTTVFDRAKASERKCDRLREPLGDGQTEMAILFDQPEPNPIPVGVATIGSIWEEDSGDERLPWWAR